jgi:opacity protein-like surface antigen
MKNLFLTAVLAMSTLVASAQFMVVTTYDGDQTENIDKLTANLGFGYQVMDGITVGVVRSLGSDAVDGDSTATPAIAAVAAVDDGYELFLRYDLGNYMEGAYATLQAPTEDASDNMKIGVGFSFNAWNALYIEPNYTMPVSETNGERDGSFNIGIGYRF